MSKQYYTIGRLLRGSFISVLKRAQFIYNNLEWTEDKGFLESVFYVKGDDEAIRRINSILDIWQESEKLR